MAGTLNKLAGQTAVYGISSIAGRMLNYLLVPFYTSIFSAAAYGVVTEIYAYVAFLNVLYTFGLETAFFRFATKEKERAGEYYQQAFSSVLWVSIFISSILALTATPIVNWLNYPGKESYIYLMAATMAVDGIVAIPFAQLRLKGKAMKFAGIKLGNIALNIGLNIFFLVICKHFAELPQSEGFVAILGSCYNAEIGVGYVFISNLIANALMVPMLFTEIAKINWFKFEWRIAKPLLVYGYPILLMGLSGMVNEMLGRAMLKKYLPANFYPNLTNEAALGVYGAVYKLSVFMQLTIQAFRYAAEPFFFSSASDKNAKEGYALVMKWFVIWCCALFVLISLNLNWLAPIFLRQQVYLTGLAAVPILLLANLFLGVYYNLSIWFKLTDKTYVGTWLSFGGAAITILGNLILIPLYGYMGSAIGTLICYGLMAAVCFYLGQKHYPIPYPTVSILLNLSIAVLVVSLTWLDTSLKEIYGNLSVNLFHLALALVWVATIAFVERKSIAILGNRLVRRGK
jgi:O-antigen/teichoic acid export membrane protein